MISDVPEVVLPDKPAPKHVWLTRNEAAALLRISRRNEKTKHLTKFILVALYTGSRKSVIMNLKFSQHTNGGWVDTKNRILYRVADDAVQTNKRAPHIRIPRKLLRHFKSWEAEGGASVIEYDGMRVESIKTSWNTMMKTAIEEEEKRIQDAKEKDKAKGSKVTEERQKEENKTRFREKRITPHSLRHTSITWAMQNGADPQKSCGFFGVTWDVMQKVYIHHHPSYQESIADAVDKAGQKTK